MRRRRYARLDEDASERAEGDLVGREAEAVDVRAFTELHLLLEVEADLVELGLDLGVGGGEAGEAREGRRGSSVTALLDEPARGLGARVS